jgi:hypothetical protein
MAILSWVSWTNVADFPAHAALRATVDAVELTSSRTVLCVSKLREPQPGDRAFRDDFQPDG